jgi:hypothetical protein
MAELLGWRILVQTASSTAGGPYEAYIWTATKKKRNEPLPRDIVNTAFGVAYIKHIAKRTVKCSLSTPSEAEVLRCGRACNGAQMIPESSIVWSLSR